MPRITLPRVRGRRARWSAIAVGAAVLLAACVPVTPPPPPPPPPAATQFCGATAPTTPAQHQALYDGLNTVNAEFGASDFGYPVDLGAGKVLYLMGDTWVGRVANDAMVDPFRMVRNAFLVQEGSCITPKFGGTRGARTDLIPPPGGDYRWPLSGFVDGSKLLVFVQRSGFGPGICGCDPLAVDLATFSLPDLVLQSVVESPRPEVLPEFGTGVLTTGGFHYIYGRDFTKTYVARVAVGADVTDGDTWRYWNGGQTGTDADWGTDGTGDCLPLGLGGPCPLTFEMPGGATSTTGPNAALYVQSDPAGGFVGSAMAADLTDPTILVWHGATPVGPWLDPQVATTAEVPPNQGFTYAAKVFRIESAGPSAPWIASYSTNVPNNHLRVSGYRVRFVDSGHP